MFDISWTELLLVGVVAIIVVGPKELPGMLRTLGKTIGAVRRMAGEFQSTFNDAIREAEQQAGIDEMRKQADAAQNFDPLGDLKKSLVDEERALQKDMNAPTPPSASATGSKEADASDTSSTPPPSDVAGANDEVEAPSVHPVAVPAPEVNTADSVAQSPTSVDEPKTAGGKN